MKLRNSILTAGALLALAAPAANAVIPSDASSSAAGYAARESSLERVSQETGKSYASSRASGYAARESSLERVSQETGKSAASSRATGYAARESSLERVRRSVSHFPYGYVPGGSSAKVTQAITDAAERMAAR